MAQFDIYRNPNTSTSTVTPYLLDVQSNLIDLVVTRVVAPLTQASTIGVTVKRLNPVFMVERKQVAMLTEQLASVHQSALGEVVSHIATERGAILAALDLLFTGI